MQPMQPYDLNMYYDLSIAMQYGGMVPPPQPVPMMVSPMLAAPMMAPQSAMTPPPHQYPATPITTSMAAELPPHSTRFVAGHTALASKHGLAHHEGKLVALATDKRGSRVLQNRLAHMSEAQLVSACEELRPHLLSLAKHSAANYVVSALVSLPSAHAALIGALRGHVAELLKHPQGSRVVQAALVELPLPAATTMVAELQGCVAHCALDTHGSWGICAAYKRTHAPFILAEVIGSLHHLAVHQHGCRVVQRTLGEAAAAGAGVAEAAEALLNGDVAALATDSYGNYVVQITLRHANPSESVRLVGALLPHLLHLASSKHGSNVAEAMLSRATHQQLLQARAAVFADLLTLRQLMAHPFGNYVLQAMLRRLGPNERVSALRTIETNSADDNFGRAIIAQFVAAGATAA